MCFLTGEQFKSCGVNLSCAGQQGSSLKVIVSMHHVFGNKATVSKLWCQCFKYLSRVKQFKSCGVDASRVFVHKEVFKKLWCQCIMFC